MSNIYARTKNTSIPLIIAYDIIEREIVVGKGKK